MALRDSLLLLGGLGILGTGIYLALREKEHIGLPELAEPGDIILPASSETIYIKQVYQWDLGSREWYLVKTMTFPATEFPKPWGKYAGVAIDPDVSRCEHFQTSITEGYNCPPPYRYAIVWQILSNGAYWPRFHSWSSDKIAPYTDDQYSGKYVEYPR